MKIQKQLREKKKTGKERVEESEKGRKNEGQIVERKRRKEKRGLKGQERCLKRETDEERKEDKEKGLEKGPLLNLIRV